VSASNYELDSYYSDLEDIERLANECLECLDSDDLEEYDRDERTAARETLEQLFSDMRNAGYWKRGGTLLISDVPDWLESLRNEYGDYLSDGDDVDKDTIINAYGNPGEDYEDFINWDAMIENYTEGRETVTIDGTTYLLNG